MVLKGQSTFYFDKHEVQMHGRIMVCCLASLRVIGKIKMWQEYGQKPLKKKQEKQVCHAGMKNGYLSIHAQNNFVLGYFLFSLYKWASFHLCEIHRFTCHNLILDLLKFIILDRKHFSFKKKHLKIQKIKKNPKLKKNES
jgi:hypothetical protein